MWTCELFMFFEEIFQSCQEVAQVSPDTIEVFRYNVLTSHPPGRLSITETAAIFAPFAELVYYRDNLFLCS